MMPYMAPVYFSTFVLASQFVLVNVVVAVLMKQLEDAKELVSPSASQASGLNTDLENQGKEDDESQVNYSKKTSHEDEKTKQEKDYDKDLNVLLKSEKQPLLSINDSLTADMSLDGDQKPGRSEKPNNDIADCTVGNETTGDDKTLPVLQLDQKLKSSDNAKNNKNKNSKDIENTLKDMLEIVVAESDKERSTEHLEVDLVGTALALSGLRDSVISTCV